MMPICSMYGIYFSLHLAFKFMVNVGKYSIHGVISAWFFNKKPRDVFPFRLRRPYYIWRSCERKGAMNGGIEVSYIISMAVGVYFLNRNGKQKRALK